MRVSDIIDTLISIHNETVDSKDRNSLGPEIISIFYSLMEYADLDRSVQQLIKSNLHLNLISSLINRKEQRQENLEIKGD
jgi:hypothetical protein